MNGFIITFYFAIESFFSPFFFCLDRDVYLRLGLIKRTCTHLVTHAICSLSIILLLMKVTALVESSCYSFIFKPINTPQQFLNLSHLSLLFIHLFYFISLCKYVTIIYKNFLLKY